MRRAVSSLVLILVVLALPLAAGAERAQLRPDGTPTVDGTDMQVLAGNLHNHSTDSDGDAPSYDIAAWLFEHRDELGLDYASFTEHSDFFPATYSAAVQPGANGADPSPLTSAGLDPWGRTSRINDLYEPQGFTVLRGFEWTNDQQNHLNVIGSQFWTSRAVTGDAAFNMTPFWEWIATNPVGTNDPLDTETAGIGGGDGIGQFNHPKSKGPLQWDDFTFHAGAAENMGLIEVDGNESGWYWFALSKGWTVAPAGNWDYHDWLGNGVLANDEPGRNCGGGEFLPCARALIIAEDNSTDSLLSALRARRASATEHPSLWATLRAGDIWQGSSIVAAPGDTVQLTVDAQFQSGDLARVTIVSDAGDQAFFHGDNISCPPADPTCKDEYVNSQHTPAYVLQDIRYETSGGRATAKSSIDTPPPGTDAAVLQLDGSDATAVIDVTVPDVPSTRPDGGHFFYAIVETTSGHRAWTAPIIVLPN